MKLLSLFKNKGDLGEDARLFKRLIAYFRPYTFIIILGIIASLCVAASTAGIAWLIKPALDDIFINKDTKMLFWLPFVFCAMTIVKGAGRYFQNLAMNYTGLKVLEELRHEVFSRIITLPLLYYESMQIGNLMSRITTDVAVMQRSLPAFVEIVRQFMTMVGLIGVVFYQNAELATYALVVLPIAASPFIYFTRKLRRYGRRNAEVAASITSILQESLSGVRVIKAFCAEEKEITRFQEENAKVRHMALRQSCVSEFSSPVMELIGAIGISFAIWFGGYQVIDGLMTTGAFFSFVASLVMLYDPLRRLMRANLEVQNAFAGAERVFSMLDDLNNMPEHGGTRMLEGALEKVELRHVNLSYKVLDDLPFAKEAGDAANKTALGEHSWTSKEESEPRLALNDVSLTIEAGSRVALVGPSGSGKTTLANTLVRFYEPQSGEILLNGHALPEYNLASLRGAVAIVAQDGFLFDMSLRENIAYGQDSIDEEAVKAAAKAAYADEFIMSMPNGYDTLVGERGVKLSGGQKQRITIARALMKNAPLLILDEATSALDSESERMVQKALDNLMQGRTSLIIAHRLATILTADKIVVMEKGRIVAEGTHEYLLSHCELYQRLYKMQFGVESLSETKQSMKNGAEA